MVVRGMSLRTPEAYLAAGRGRAQPYHQRPAALSAPPGAGYLRLMLCWISLVPPAMGYCRALRARLSQRGASGTTSVGIVHERVSAQQLGGKLRNPHA